MAIAVEVTFPIGFAARGNVDIFFTDVAPAYAVHSETGLKDGI